MKKIAALFAVIVFSLLAPLSIVSAQTEEAPDSTVTPPEDIVISPAPSEAEDVTDTVFVAFTVENYVGAQSAVSGKIPVYVYIVPKLDAFRAVLKWDVPHGLATEGELETWFAMQNGVGQQFTLYVTPEQAGSYTISAEIVAYGFDENYVDSTTINVEIDNTLRAVPISDAYQRQVLLLSLGKVFIVIVALVGLFVLYKFLVKNLPKWKAKQKTKPASS